jgi:GEVED domain/Secretion system C-terminal sorting domain/Pregnancy-associated plasma protein-A
MIPTLTKKSGYSLFLFSLFSTFLCAQTPAILTEKNQNNLPTCGTLSPSPDAMRYTLDVVMKQLIVRNAGTTCVPIQAHILRNDDGTGGLTTKELNEGLANLNYMFKPANIEFYWAAAPKYVNNTDYYNFDKRATDADTEDELKALLSLANNAVNVCYVNQIITETGKSTTGYAYGPRNAAYTNFMVLNRTYYNTTVNGVFSHEFGHYFDLPHTFEGTKNGNMDANAENVPRSGINANCSTKGDMMCDTEADPDGTSANCVYTGGASDKNGIPYTPPIGNVMSYYSYSCGVLNFTPNQYTRITQALATRLTHTAYTLNAPPMSVNDPSGLTVVQSVATSAAVLNWTDNALNEVGYLIERSTTSNSSGFVPVAYGGTSENVTTFIDGTVSVGTTYYYRVKASNDNCNDYSNVVAFTPTLSYCQPYYLSTCKTDNGNSPRYIGVVSIKTIANVKVLEKLDSDCSSNLSDFTATSGNVVAGTTYNATVKLKEVGGWYPLKVGIWLDINNDKDFDDAGEYLGNGVISFSSVTIPITIPLVTYNGGRRLRIRAISPEETMSSTASCGNFAVGETEDYTLNVSGGVALRVELLDFKATKRTEKSAVISWKTTSEKDIDKLILQVSNDAKNYATLIEMRAKGSPNQIENYQFEHLDPLKGVNYYRLMERGFDGKMRQVAQGSLTFMDKTSFTLQPNPTQDVFTLGFYADRSEKVNVVIYDMLGRIVLTPQYVTQIGDNQMVVELPSTLPNGVYFVRLEQNGILKTAKFKKEG